MHIQLRFFGRSSLFNLKKSYGYQSSSDPYEIGLQMRRKCLNAEVDVIRSYYDDVKTRISMVKDEHSWINMFYQGKNFYYQQQTQQNPYINLSKQLLGEFFPKLKLKPLSIGYIISPKNTVKDQQFHKDYFKGNLYSIFIPLVPLTTKNSTQFLTIPFESEPQNTAQGFYGDDLKLLETMESHHKMDHYMVHQIVCKAYSILTIKGQTIHRGIGNKQDEDRPMFYILGGQEYVQIEQKGYNTTASLRAQLQQKKF